MKKKGPKDFATYAEYTRYRRQRAKDRGKCGICTSRWAEEWMDTCRECLDYQAGIKQKRRQK